MGKEPTILPAGDLLYLYTSQRTILFFPLLKGSLNKETGYKYMSELEPSA